jgi:hypothetical protein
MQQCTCEHLYFAGETVDEPERQRLLLLAAKQVGHPLFYSLLIIVGGFENPDQGESGKTK